MPWRTCLGAPALEASRLRSRFSWLLTTSPVIARLIAFLLSLAAARGAIESVNELPFAEDCVLRTWEVADGLRDNHISSIARGPDGYLWVTNFSGLFRFDGIRFVQMDRAALPGLPTPWVAPVFSARDGSLWLGLERGGVARLRRGKIDTLVPIQPRPTAEIWPWSFAEDGTGGVWWGAGNEARVSRFAEGRVRTFSIPEGIPGGGRTTVGVTSDGKVWAATSRGCAVFDGERFQNIDPGAGGATRLMLAPAGSGGMWAIRGGKLLRYDSVGIRLETIAPPWLREIEQVNALLEDRSGTLWIGTRDFGLLRFRGGDFERVPTSFGDISFLTEDQEGHLWAGTWGGGLNRLSLRHFFLRQTQAGRPHDALRSLCEDAGGRLWAVGRGADPVRVSEPAGRAFSPAPGWPVERRPAVVCAGPEGDVWLGASDGLARWRDGQWKRTSLTEPVVTLFTARDGTLWIATEAAGLFRHRDGQTTAVDGPRQPRSLAEDARGRLWVGDQRGDLYFRENDHFSPVALPRAGGDETVRFLVPDGRNTMWIGTLLGGLFRWKNGQVVRVSASSGDSLAELRSLLIEPETRVAGQKRDEASARDVFWIGTATGLLRITREDLEGFLDGRRAVLNLVSCGSNEGLPTLEFAVANAAVRTRDGRLCFATNRGLLEIQPGTRSERPAGGRVLVEEGRADSFAFSPAPFPTRLPPRPDAIRLRYTLPELGVPERVRFRYRLGDGTGEGPWIDAGPQREATIVRPEPGRYRFEVTAAVDEGPWLSPSAVMEFAVSPAWWQTGLFRGAAALAFAGTLVAAARGIVMRRMRAKIRRLEQERAVERERARIARDMHDELGANLTLIAAMARFSASEPGGEARQLGEIENTARQTVESMDEIVWAVNPRNDTLAGTVEYIGKFATGFLSRAGVETEVLLPDTVSRRPVSAELRHQLFLAVKESLGNVVKHSGATSVRLKVQVSPERLEITVADNGRGLAPGAVDSDPFSNGLDNMQARMAGIGGSCRIESRAGAGCRIVFELPLRNEAQPGNSA